MNPISSVFLATGLMIAAVSAQAYTINCDQLPRSCNMSGLFIESADRAPTPSSKIAPGTVDLLYGVQGGTGDAMPLLWALPDSGKPNQNFWLYNFKANSTSDFRVQVDFDRGTVGVLCDDGYFTPVTCQIYQGPGSGQ